MLNFEEFEWKLVIKESSTRLWIFAVLLFVIFWTWNAFKSNGVVFLLVGIWSIIFVLFSFLTATKDEVVINRKTRELTVNRKSFVRFNTKYQTYKFDELGKIIEFEKRQIGKSENYFAYVETLDNKKIELFDSSASTEGKFFTVFKLSNQYFIGLSNEDFQLQIT